MSFDSKEPVSPPLDALLFFFLFFLLSLFIFPWSRYSAYSSLLIIHPPLTP